MNGRNHHQCSRKFKWAGGKTILEAPARTGTAFGFEGNDEETASSFGRSSHADTDRKTLDLADQTIGPSCGRWRVPGERQSDASDGTIMIHRLHDERYQRWQNLIAGFLIHASRGIIRHDGQHEYAAVLCGPTCRNTDSAKQILKSFEQAHDASTI